MAMGFEWVDHFDEDDDTEKTPLPDAPIQQVINLLSTEDDGDYVDASSSSQQTQDPWTQNAHRIRADLARMAGWIQHKQHEYEARSCSYLTFSPKQPPPISWPFGSIHPRHKQVSLSIM